ncbi:tetratricopeptide repeat protein [Limnofasciculus baicalensis]|uniref:Tetratricopeptide repeat protein n=1 Tax=Limnofasciculus baicalensis BBK-W-15 TaxID=2699891 RepID=A0AAE3KQN1_9CYAN|nr:tetratricopeptide repeat protein [Limnofasciculus baicalensis]MCP2727547.1 tetratricopeptide repeat protein [Limnofasciculus baicalensis BBK-W-15]
MKLSLCTIVKNEEKSLPRVLDSVKTLVDEMVIIDTGSTDRTVEIAKDYGARVYYFNWCNDFSVARNYGLQYVKGNWVLVLDADEVLTPEIVPEIKRVIECDAVGGRSHRNALLEGSRYLVVNLIRREVGASQSPYSLVSRLFRRHREIRFSRPYHAMVDDSVQSLLQREPHWQVISLPNVAINHYGYKPEAIAALDKYNRAQIAMEGFLANHPNDGYVCSKLGALYIAIGEVSQGIELLERGLTDPHVEGSVLFELHYHLGNACTRENNFNSAAEHYQAAIQQPILPHLKLGAYNNLGGLLLRVGDLVTAKMAYQMALEIDPSFAVGHNNLGMTLKAMGQLTDAIASYQQAIKLNPDYADAYQNLGVVLLKIGKIPESLSAFTQAIALHSVHNQAEAQRLDQGLKDMGFLV